MWARGRSFQSKTTFLQPNRLQQIRVGAAKTRLQLFICQKNILNLPVCEESLWTQRCAVTGYPDAGTIWALTCVYLHCMKKKQQHSQPKGIQVMECDPVTTSHWCCACCHVKMCPLFLQHIVGPCPVAATSTDSTLSFVTKGRKIFPTVSQRKMICALPFLQPQQSLM